MRGCFLHVLVLAWIIATASPTPARAECVDYSLQARIVGHCDFSARPRGVAVSGAFGYVTSEDSGLQVVDLSDPTSPQLAGALYFPIPWDVAVSDFVRMEWNGEVQSRRLVVLR